MAAPRPSRPSTLVSVLVAFRRFFDRGRPLPDVWFDRGPHDRTRHRLPADQLFRLPPSTRIAVSASARFRIRSGDDFRQDTSRMWVREVSWIVVRVTGDPRDAVELRLFAAQRCRVFLHGVVQEMPRSRWFVGRSSRSRRKDIGPDARAALKHLPRGALRKVRYEALRAGRRMPPSRSAWSDQ